MRACYADRPQKLLSGIYFQLIWQHPLLLCSILSNIDGLSFVLKKNYQKVEQNKAGQIFLRNAWGFLGVNVYTLLLEQKFSW